MISTSSLPKNIPLSISNELKLNSIIKGVLQGLCNTPEIGMQSITQSKTDLKESDRDLFCLNLHFLPADQYSVCDSNFKEFHRHSSFLHLLQKQPISILELTIEQQQQSNEQSIEFYRDYQLLLTNKKDRKMSRWMQKTICVKASSD
ncbi:MAG: hypothetical protein ACRCU9_10060 [Iodobacter sp.]